MSFPIMNTLLINFKLNRNERLPIIVLQRLLNHHNKYFFSTKPFLFWSLYEYFMFIF
jgi:hypothetical protein